MHEIVVSYDHDDRSAVARLVEALERHDLEVWWDPDMETGSDLHAGVERQIRTDGTSSVLVVWTGSSVRSDWVRDEATLAKSLGKYVPVKLEDVEIPLSLRTKVHLDLGEADLDNHRDPTITKLASDLRRRAVSSFEASKTGGAEDSGIKVPRAKLKQVERLDIQLEEALNVFVTCHTSLSHCDPLIQQLKQGRDKLDLLKDSNYWNIVGSLFDQFQNQPARFGSFGHHDRAMQRSLGDLREELKRGESHCDRRTMEEAIGHCDAIRDTLHEATQEAKTDARKKIVEIRRTIEEIFTREDERNRYRKKFEEERRNRGPSAAKSAGYAAAAAAEDEAGRQAGAVNPKTRRRNAPARSYGSDRDNGGPAFRSG